MRSSALIGPALIGVAVSLGCGGLPHPRFAQQATAALKMVGYPPPPARVEFIPRRPGDQAVWLDGEWTWSGSAWAWVPGRWVVPPPGSSFAPWTTVRDDQGNVYFAPGSWRDERGAELPAPPALATASSTEGDVTSPAGDDEKTARPPPATSTPNSGPNPTAKP